MRKLVIALGFGFVLSVGLHPANAEIVVSFTGTSGTGKITATISGSDVTTSAKPSAQVIAGKVPNFIDAAAGARSASGIAASCAVDSLPGVAIDLSARVLAGSPDGVDGVDSISIDVAEVINPATGSTITCDGTFDLPVDIANITLPSDVTFVTSRGMTVRFTTLRAAGPNSASASEAFRNQQRAASTLAMNTHSNTLGEGIFNRLGKAFNRSSEHPKVTTKGISASMAGIANLIDKKQREKLKRDLASLPKDENGNSVVVAPVAGLFPVNERLWNAWIEGSWNFYDGDGSSFDGHSADVLTGVDYRVSRSVVLGLLGGYGNTDFETFTDDTSGAFSADGYTVGPYGAVKLSEHVQFDGLIAYTYSDYENRSGTTTGGFSADRVTVGAQLKGTWEKYGYFTEPGVRVLYAQEQQNAYMDSDGVMRGGLSDTAGRVSVGPKFGYTYNADNGDVLRPWASVRGEYDFSNLSDNPIGGLPDLNDILSARTTAGLDAKTPGGVDVTIQGDVSGIGGGEYTGYGASARIGLPF